MSRRLALIWAVLVSFSCVLQGAEPKSEPAKGKLSYLLKISENGANVLARASGIDLSKPVGFKGRGLIAGTEVRSRKNEGTLEYQYNVPLDKDKIRRAGNPFIGGGRFTAFGSGVFLFPDPRDVIYNDISLEIQVPEGKALVTSRGKESRYKFDQFTDLMGLLICAGDYATYEFDAPHHDAEGKPTGESTKVYVAIHGERDWDDKTMVSEFQRIVSAQMKFFGGAHPAPFQLLALHLCPRENGPPDVPAFNRRAPGHDTILAYHTPDRPRDSFEFLGMLSHEHLHNWYPFAINSNLGAWFMEGLNDYVAYRCLMAEGLHDRDQFSGMLSKWYREYLWALANPKHPIMPYRRGMIAGWIMDIELRRSSGGKFGLRDVLLENFQKPPADGIVKRADLIAAMNKAAGKDMKKLYEILVEKPDPIDVKAYLEGSGFHISESGKQILISPKTEEEKALLEDVLQ